MAHVLPDLTAVIRASLQGFVDDGFITATEADEAAVLINQTSDEATLGALSFDAGLERIKRLADAHSRGTRGEA